MELVTPVTSLDGDRKYNSTWAKVELFPKCLMLIAGHSVGPLKPYCLWSTKEKKGDSVFRQLLPPKGLDFLSQEEASP